MICRPFSGDQKIISRYVSHVWRVGIELENVIERGEIERAIKLMMVEKEGEEIRQRAADVKLELQLSVQKGGSSYNSLNELVEFIVPFFGDQNLNVRYVCDVWNVGLELESGKIEKAIRKLMVDREGEEMRKRAKHLKQKVDMSLKEARLLFIPRF
ncbi:hypothetical protein LWI29_003401 [Acer saccharum]|uniref:Uncharacterized protein n=1 Tax=Acer saccharum TaxID=4024 RepID=A0AA39TAX5_ACESA|nr:hypothetical protein LWI29_003401 [Acer saccharum]